MRLLAPQPNQVFRLSGSGNAYFSNSERIIDAPDHAADLAVLRSLGCVDAPVAKDNKPRVVAAAGKAEGSAAQALSAMAQAVKEGEK